MQHLAELGVDEADLRAYGADSVARTHNTVMQAAKTHHTSTAQVPIPSALQPCMLQPLESTSLCNVGRKVVNLRSKTCLSVLDGLAVSVDAGVLVALRERRQVRDVGVVRAQSGLR